MSNTNKEQFGPFKITWPSENVEAGKETDSAEEILKDFRNYMEPFQCYKFLVDMFLAYTMHYDTVSSDNVSSFLATADLIFKCEQHVADRHTGWAIARFMEHVLNKEESETQAAKKIIESMTERYGSLANGISHFRGAAGK